MTPLTEKMTRWLPRLDRQIWILMVGRLLSQLGTGFVLFYAPIYFANQVGLSEAAVGFGIGLGSVTGVVGRILGGTLADSPSWGRRKTLLLAAAVSAIADFTLALSTNFPLFLIGNLLMGFGIGLYWPANETVVADLTTLDQRNDAFALTRLADSLGLGLGVVLGGWLIAASGAYQALFWIDGISYMLFAAVISGSITETLSPHPRDRSLLQSWNVALRDRILVTFTLVNILFTTYLALGQTALPLYFTNFIPGQANGQGFDATILSTLFSWNVALSALLQLPIARLLNRVSRSIALMISAGFWGLTFILIGLTGVVSSGNLIWASLGMVSTAIASVAYLPAASALVADLAPADLRGVYLAINSLCWAVGYFIGPTVGGWAMSRSAWFAHSFWFLTAATVSLVLMILRSLHQMFVEEMNYKDGVEEMNYKDGVEGR